ncbi:MAG: transposase [Kiritimatiellaeota bacterium]|nr:transposase [Kiritimatiellota bacterium]
MDAEDHHPVRHTTDLHRGRWSAGGVHYFITCCLQRPATGLTMPGCAASIRSAWQTLTTDGDVLLECATIMPDHLHALLVLGPRLQLGRVIAKLKALTRGTLLANDFVWQRDFFEHHLRANEHPSPFARYIFLNPYRAGLLERRAVWSTPI